MAVSRARSSGVGTTHKSHSGLVNDDSLAKKATAFFKMSRSLRNGSQVGHLPYLIPPAVVGYFDL